MDSGRPPGERPRPVRRARIVAADRMLRLGFDDQADLLTDDEEDQDYQPSSSGGDDEDDLLADEDIATEGSGQRAHSDSVDSSADCDEDEFAALLRQHSGKRARRGAAAAHVRPSPLSSFSSVPDSSSRRRVDEMHVFSPVSIYGGALDNLFSSQMEPFHQNHDIGGDDMDSMHHGLMQRSEDDLGCGSEGGEDEDGDSEEKENEDAEEEEVEDEEDQENGEGEEEEGGSSLSESEVDFVRDSAAEEQYRQFVATLTTGQQLDSSYDLSGDFMPNESERSQTSDDEEYRNDRAVTISTDEVLELLRAYRGSQDAVPGFVLEAVVPPAVDTAFDQARFTLANLSELKAQVHELIELCILIMLSSPPMAKSTPTVVYTCWTILLDCARRFSGASDGAVASAAAADAAQLPVYEVVVSERNRSATSYGARLRNIYCELPAPPELRTGPAPWAVEFVFAQSMLVYVPALRDTLAAAPSLGDRGGLSMRSGFGRHLSHQLSVLYEAGLVELESLQSYVPELEPEDEERRSNVTDGHSRLTFTPHEDMLLVVGFLRFGRSALREIQYHMMPHKTVLNLQNRVRNRARVQGDVLHDFVQLRSGPLVDFEVDWVLHALRDSSMTWQIIHERYLPYRQRVKLTRRWRAQISVSLWPNLSSSIVVDAVGLKRRHDSDRVLVSAGNIPPELLAPRRLRSRAPVRTASRAAEASAAPPGGAAGPPSFESSVAASEPAAVHGHVRSKRLWRRDNSWLCGCVREYAASRSARDSVASRVASIVESLRGSGPFPSSHPIHASLLPASELRRLLSDSIRDGVPEALHSTSRSLVSPQWCKYVLHNGH